MPALSLNADISVTVTAMTLYTFHYSYNISHLFLEIHCQYGQKKWWENIE